jgi:hypothetical protein
LFAHPGGGTLRDSLITGTLPPLPPHAAQRAAAAPEGNLAMASATFAPCPQCQTPLAFLVGVTSSRMDPKCPSCHAEIPVTRATWLMADNSRPSEARNTRAPLRQP